MFKSQFIRTFIILLLLNQIGKAQTVSTIINEPRGDDIHFYNGHLYSTDYGNSIVRKISMDGVAEEILKGYPTLGAIEVTSDGTIYATNYNLGYLIRFREGGKVDTLVTGMSGPAGLAADPSGNLFINQNAVGIISKYSKDGSIKPLLKGLPLYWNTAITLDEEGNVYSNNMWTGELVKVDRNGNSRVIAELPARLDSDPDLGYLDFHNGQLYALHLRNNCLYIVDPETGFYSNYAGIERQSGYKDGDVTEALFDDPVGIEIDPIGSAIFITDGKEGHQRLRKVSLEAKIDFTQIPISISKMEFLDNSKLVYTLKANQTSSVHVEVRNSLDEIIDNETWQFKRGLFNQEVGFHGQGAGTYFVTLKVGPFQHTIKVNKE